ncbi:hypothetical protein D6D01_04159 [Aureobasidium pullulans]|uniref:C2H2-type domain-containing protein n=1 Tax=Aureobasidium pullulans TaxID=5580 RepID=A0A4V4JVY8_AURPU|nr:hypothetical protein D6D01_04159 [Aureobasidium pullulans]
MPAASSSTTLLPAAGSASPSISRKSSASAPEKKYKCQFCNRAFSRSEHRSRHERSHTKERPFKCLKCRSTFVRRDLLLRHDRTVHAKDGGVPLQSDTKRRSNASKQSPEAAPPKLPMGMEQAAIEQMSADDGMFGVEEAAMLMTNFQQKAAMSTQMPEPVLAEPSYPQAGSMTLPQMPQTHWDTMMPQPMAKSQSISSQSTTAGHDGRLPQASAGPMGIHSQLPPLMEQQFGNASLSALGTPGALSPFPSMMGPVSPVDYRRSPGPAQVCTMPKPPQVESEDQIASILQNIKHCDSEGALLDTFRLPHGDDLNRYLSTYFTLFHHHLPFLHPSSFNPAHVSAPLLLSVLSVGALYAFEQDSAYMLHIGSKLLINQFLVNKENFSSRKCPIWAMQATLLNMIFASWSGDPKGLEWACSVKSLVANMVAGNRYELKLRSEARQGAQPNHQEWIEDESCRRTYYAVYIFFGLLTMTYNHTPAISFNEFDTLELPSSETLWALDVNQSAVWHESMKATSIITFQESHCALFQGEPARYSAFATRVMINALFLEVWYHKRCPEALQDVVTEYKLRLALESWEKSLDICEPETVVVQLSAPHRGHPLIFNAMAVYRNTTARLMVDLKSVQEALRYHDPYEVAAAMTNARDKVKRSPEMLKVIQACFDCVEVAAVHGIRWVARTSATNWSIEHPLCGLDLMVILTLWLWRVEHDEEAPNAEEIAMYEKLRNLFDDDSVDMYGRLSSSVARLWGSMIDEVVVWGITKLMGESFKLHAQALAGYEEAMLAQEQAHSAPSMTSHNLAVAAY